MRNEADGSRRRREKAGEVRLYVLTEVGDRVSVEVSELRWSNPAQAVLSAAGSIAYNSTFQFSGAVAVVRGLAPAAGMGWRSQSLHRGRNKTSSERKEKKQSGG